jgi:hypothetical protein
MTTPYIYRIINGSKWYIGSRMAKGCHPDDLGVKYFTSSKEIQKDFKDNTKSWTKEILYVGTDSDNIEELEGLILQMLNAKNDLTSYNKHNNQKLLNNNWNSSKAGKLGIQKMTTEARRRGGLTNGITGHNKKIASSGGKAYYKRFNQDAELRKTAVERFKRTAKVKETCRYCGITADLGNLTRWHNDNCKDKK